MRSVRTFPIGAEVIKGSGVSFRVWAPRTRTLAVELSADGQSVTQTSPLTRDADGYFEGLIPAAGAGTLYRFRLEHGSFPDPASRFQPQGPHGWSQVVDHDYAWTDANWRGRPSRELVIYELHVGTFTPAGTWRAAMDQLPEIARIGITMIEIMPVAEFPGKFGWGYDGVDQFAPTHLYGTPDELRAFVNRAHELGLAVILDVVYNHIGPDGNYLREFSPHYFSTRYQNEWGDPLNFDDEHSAPVREFFVTNARYWIREFHFDGLRLDATQQIFDASPNHIIAEVTEAVRAEAPGRHTFVVAENECQHARLVRARGQGGYGLDALWNDDFHHSAMVAATGRAEAYYSGYRGVAQEFVSSAKYGFLYQGGWYRWQRQRRGRPALDLQPRQFVTFLQNHDQIANSLRGARVHQMAGPALVRALTTVLLLSPQIPLLFQGDEFAASSPFFYFADHHPELRAQVAKGRTRFLQQFPSVATPEATAELRDPGDERLFLESKLRLEERVTHASTVRLYTDLLRLRREDSTIADPKRIDGAVLSERTFLLRYFSPENADRLLIVNLGTDLWLDPAPEPLLAPMEDRSWRVLWSSESPVYGGGGTAALETKANWIIPGHMAVLLCPDELRELPDAILSQTH